MESFPRSRDMAESIYQETLEKIEDWTRELLEDRMGQLSGIKNSASFLYDFAVSNKQAGRPVDLVVIGEGNAGWAMWFGTSRAPFDTSLFENAWFVEPGEQYLYRPERACVFIEASCSGSEHGLYAPEREKIACLARKHPDRVAYVGFTCSPHNHLATIAGGMENSSLTILPSKSKHGEGDDTFIEIMGDRIEHKLFVGGEVLVQELARLSRREPRDPIREELDALHALADSEVFNQAYRLADILVSRGEDSRIIVGATDRTSIATRDFVNRMTQSGRQCYDYKAVNQPAISSRDTTLSASGSGEGTRALGLARDGKKAGAMTIGITAVEDSDLASIVNGKIVLPLPGGYGGFFSSSQKEQTGVIVSLPEDRDYRSYFRPTIFEKELRVFLSGVRNMVLYLEEKPDSWMRKKHN